MRLAGRVVTPRADYNTTGQITIELYRFGEGRVVRRRHGPFVCRRERSDGKESQHITTGSSFRKIRKAVQQRANNMVVVPATLLWCLGVLSLAEGDPSPMGPTVGNHSLKVCAALHCRSIYRAQ